ncbi:MAG: hypothetical protein J1D99_01335, partial [Campylobacter sp.]|nr:hypothetical protein [Campylobacter sp.]
MIEQEETKLRIAKILGLVDSSQITQNFKCFCIGNEKDKIKINKEINFKELSNYPLVFKNCVFENSLRCVEVNISNVLRFENCVFEKIVNFNSSRFKNFVCIENEFK